MMEATIEIWQVVMTLMPPVNAIIGIVVVSWIVHRLLCCTDQYNRAERAGMGAIAGGIIMATPALWVVGTPFDGWSFNVARAGMALYIITGGMRRDRHHRRNLAQIEYWAGYEEGKARTLAAMGRPAQ